jgi:phosphoglycolate phosphatase
MHRMMQSDHSLSAWRPSAVVWDLDGTLVESAPDLATALNGLLNEQGQYGHPVSNVRAMIGGGVAKLIERGFRAAGAPLDPAEIDALVPRFMELYTDCATDSTHLVPHAREVLLHFYHAGMQQALCTNKPAGVTHLILDALDISGFFGCVVGGDTTAHKKPHPLPLETCLNTLGVQPEPALMVGDPGANVGAAQAAGVTVILVPDGYTGVSAASLGADHVINSLADIPAWIGLSQNTQRGKRRSA